MALVTIDPTDVNTLYVGVRGKELPGGYWDPDKGALYKSTDGGLTFGNDLLPHDTDNGWKKNAIYSLAIDPMNRLNLYIGQHGYNNIQQEVMKSQNGGATWTLLSTTAWVNNSGSARVKLAAVPNTSTVWVITGENQGHGVYYSTAGGNKGWGRRTALNDPNGSQTWLYDLHGRVVSTAQTINGAPATYTTSFTYDAMERVRTLVYPDGEVVTSVYNNQGLPDTLIGANNYVNATTYNAASQLDALTFGNGALTDYVYNPNNLRLTDIVTTKSGNTLLNLHYNFDNAGNILSVQDTARGETTNYAYDDLDRLLSASVTTGGNQYNRSWTYDALGNMQTRVEQGAPTNYNYDANHKHAVASAGGATYQYDANGNMTNHNGDALTYDVENRLTSVAKGGVTTSFAYNGDGTRVKRSVSNAGTTYYIGNYFEVWVPNSGTTTFNKYYYFGAQRVAARIASTLFYFQGDHLGSSSIAMTQAGTSFYSRQTYFPYGAPRTAEGSALPTDYTFTGQKNDDSTGLLFYNARYYDTTLGRFTQPDTIVPNLLDSQSLNRYAYVQNNPVRYTDPSGHMMCGDADGCAGGGGGGGGNGGGGNVNPCNADPTAEGCPGAQEAVPPAETGENQGQADSDDSCHSAARKCDGDYDPETDEQSPGISPAAIYINDYDLDGHRIFRAFAWFDSHPGYVPLNDPYFERIQGDLSQDYWKWDMEKLAAANPNPADLFLAFGMGMAAIAGRGSTGRATPNNLSEKLAMEQAMSNPKVGLPLDVKMTDSRWPASEGWTKMAQNINGVEIHYNYNPGLEMADDFKFK